MVSDSAVSYGILFMTMKKILPTCKTMTSTYEQQKALESTFGLAETAPATSSLQTIASLKAAIDMFKDSKDPADMDATSALQAVAKEELRMTALGAQLISGTTKGSVALQQLCGTGAEGAARAGALAKQYAARKSFDAIMESAAGNKIGDEGTTILSSLQRNGMARFDGRSTLFSRPIRQKPADP